MSLREGICTPPDVDVVALRIAACAGTPIKATRTVAEQLPVMS